MRLHLQQALGSRFRALQDLSPERRPLERKMIRQRVASRSRSREANLKMFPDTPPISRVLISDDHAVVRRGVRALVETDPSLVVVGEAATGTETIDQVQKLKPDIVVLDISLPEKNGLDVTRLLRRESPETKVVILTMHFAEEVARECLRAGARAYVVKSDSNDEVLAAVRAVRDERAFFTPQIKDLYYTGYMDCVPNAPAGADGEIPIDRLTTREREVVKLLCEGMSNKEVAYSVGISTRTVESHRNNVMRKLNLDAFSQLIRYAIRHGVVTA
jgi:DNA-binding NarL/FixJ family response regulator